MDRIIMSSNQAAVNAPDQPGSAPSPSRDQSQGTVRAEQMATPLAFTGRSPSDLGMITHLLIAVHAGRVADGVAPSDLVPCLVSVCERVIDATPSRRRALTTQAVGLAMRYMTDFVPSTPWRLLGAEYPTGCGTVDVAWSNPDTEQVFFDEVKTANVPGGFAPHWVRQAARYTRGGRAQYGDAFLGTRLIPLRAPCRTVVVLDRNGGLGRLSRTAAEPWGLPEPTGGQR